MSVSPLKLSWPAFQRFAFAAVLAAASCIFASCKEKTALVDTAAEPPPPSANSWFADATTDWRLDFVHDPGPTGTYSMPQSMGSGAAVLDFDGDGLLDVYILNFAGPNSASTNRLFRQTAPGKFEDVTAGSGLGIAGHNHGAAVGDVNNDGKPDILVTQFGAIKLFLNQGGGKFIDVSVAAGLINPMWGASAAFLDYDRDGWLDLVVVNYLSYDPKVECRSPEGVLDFCGPNSFAGTASKLFRNLGGDAAKFQDVSLTSGIGRLTSPGLGVSVADFNGDGWKDIFIANDGKPNRLWINQKNGTFEDEATSRGIAYTATGKAYAGMGVAVGDTMNRGLLDIYVSHLGSEMNNLWRQESKGQFRDRTADSGLSTPRWRGTGFGTLMGDFNCDGGLDIALVNGKVHRGGPAKNTKLGFWQTYAEKNQIFANDGLGKFRDASQENPAFCDYWNVARGLVCADFDNDGGLDLLVVPIGDRARVFRNAVVSRGSWLKVQSIDPARKRDMYGAEIRVKAGGKEYFRVISPAESYLCSGPPIAHFGLGSADAFESIRVTWPDGAVETEVFPGGGVNRSIVLKRGEGKKP